MKRRKVIKTLAIALAASLGIPLFARETEWQADRIVVLKHDRTLQLIINGVVKLNYKVGDNPPLTVLRVGQREVLKITLVE